MKLHFNTFKNNVTIGWKTPTFPGWSLLFAVLEEGYNRSRPPVGDKVPELIGDLLCGERILACGEAVSQGNSLGEAYEMNFRGRPPYRTGYDPHRDWRRYGSNARLFADLLWGEFGSPIPALSQKSHKGEKEVTHVDPIGTAKITGTGGPPYYLYGDDPLYRNLYGYHAPLLGRSSALGTGANGPIRRYLTTARWGLSERYDQSARVGSISKDDPKTSIEDIVPLLEAYFNEENGPHRTYQYYSTGRYSYCVYSNLNIWWDQLGHYRVSYTVLNYILKYDNWPEGPFNSADYVVKFDVVIESVDHAYAREDYFPDFEISHDKLASYRSEVTESWYLNSGKTRTIVNDGVRTLERRMYSLFTSDPINSVSRSYIDPANARPTNGARFFRDTDPLCFKWKYGPRGSLIDTFSAMVLADMRSLRPSAARSFSDAVSNFEEVISTNMLETLSEMSSIFEVLPDIKKIPQFMLLLKKGKFIAAFDVLLDFATGTNLQYQFGTAPNVQTAREIIDRAPRIKERLLSLSSPRTAYGNFYYEFPKGTYGYEYSTLVTRTKVRISGSESALAKAIQASAALGVQPNLENFWEVIPYSFAIDWFVNLGDRFANIDAQLKAFVYEIEYCVHSYTVTNVIDEENLKRYGLESEESDFPALRFYRREVSHLPPSLRDSKYNFEDPTGPRNKGIVGSLIYQKLR